MHKTTLAFLPSDDNPRVGTLCVKHSDVYGETPVMTMLYWPVVFGHRSDFAEAFRELDTDAELRDATNGSYFFYRGNGCYSPTIRLVNGGQTLPIKTENVPIPCPKVRAGIETRFRSGYWQKYLKSKGWIAA